MSLCLLITLPLLPYGVYAYTQDTSSHTSTVLATDLWRAVRQRDGSTLPSYTQMKQKDAATLINTGGQEWRHFRMQQLIPISAWVLGLLAFIILLYHFVRGKMTVSGGASNQQILRFSRLQRVVHWTTAITFLCLGFTGITLLYGRFVLIPLLGPEGFGITANLAKIIHDYVGPVFGVSLFIMLITFLPGNLPNLKVDLKWLLKGGGLFGGSHPSAGRYNAGEKLWFWLAILGGGLAVFSGIMMAFPFFSQVREDLTLYHMIHGISTLLLFAASFGHIYMGTLAMDGTIDIMKSGYCDANWAKEHHDIWYDEQLEKGLLVDKEADMATAPPATHSSLSTP